MKQKLDAIRKADKRLPLGLKIAISIALLLLGVGLGVLQKYLDSTAVNELPAFLQTLDITNFFGRFAIWIFLGVVISIYCESPFRACLNCFLFFAGMVAAYYIYCKFVLGFLPTGYMLIWLGAGVGSVIPAFLCWYAKGEGIVALIISGIILGVLFSQAFLFIHGFGVTHLPEVVVFVLALFVLRRKPKEFLIEIGIALLVAVVYQLFVPVWG